MCQKSLHWDFTFSTLSLGRLIDTWLIISTQKALKSIFVSRVISLYWWENLIGRIWILKCTVLKAVFCRDTFMNCKLSRYFMILTQKSFNRGTVLSLILWKPLELRKNQDLDNKTHKTVPSVKTDIINRFLNKMNFYSTNHISRHWWNRNRIPDFVVYIMNISVKIVIIIQSQGKMANSRTQDPNSRKWQRPHFAPDLGPLGPNSCTKI